MTILGSEVMSTLDDKITKSQPMWERHHGMTVNKCDSVHSFHRSSTHIHLTNYNELHYRLLQLGKAHNARHSWGTLLLAMRVTLKPP